MPERTSSCAARANARPSLQLLGVHDHRARRRVADERAQDLGRVDVGLVADGDEAREAEVVLGHAQVELLAEAAALRDQTDGAGQDVEVGDGEQLAGRVGDAEAVGPDEQSARGPQARDRRLLAGPSLGAHLAQHRGHGDDRFDAHGDAVVDDRLEELRRHGQDDELRSLRQVAQRGVRGTAEDLPAPPVHEVHRAPVLALQQAGAHVAAPLREVAGRADDGDRARREERRQVARPGVGRAAPGRRAGTLGAGHASPSRRTASASASATAATARSTVCSVITVEMHISPRWAMNTPRLMSARCR